MTILYWFLDRIYPPLAAAIRAFFAKRDEEVQAQVAEHNQEVMEHEQEIDAETEANKQGVDGMDESDLDSILRHRT